MRAAIFLLTALGCLSAGCGGKGPGRANTAAEAPTPQADLIAREARVLAQLAAADPRLAARSKVVPPRPVVEGLAKQIGTSAVLAEDTTFEIRGGSFDLFAFQARGQVFDLVARELETWPVTDEHGPPGGPVARPRLERELLGRLLEAERARLADESKLDGYAGDLVRGMVSTWATPASGRERAEQDEWAAKRLDRIRESVQATRAPTGDLDDALYDLERLLTPEQYPKALHALTDLRLAMDANTAPEPPGYSPEQLAHAAKVHLGLTIDVPAQRARWMELADALGREAEAAREGRPIELPPIAALEEQILEGTADCDLEVHASPVRGMDPPPEREALCGALTAIARPLPGREQVVLAALHDLVVVAAWALDPSAPRLSVALLTADNQELASSFQKLAARHPLVPIGVAAALEIVRAGGAQAARERAERWLEFGDAPLDVVARELGSQ